MKKLWIMLLLAGTSLLSGCFDMVEELFLEANGSGHYLLTMDMSNMISDPFMKGMLQESLQEEGGLTEIQMEKDTLIYLKNTPDIASLSVADQKLLENVTIQMTMSEAKEQFFIKIDMPFSNVSQLADISKAMEKVNMGNQLSGGMLGGGMMSGAQAIFSLSKKSLRRAPTKQAPTTAEDEASIDMLRLFMGEAEYRTVYHLPSKVKKVTIPKARTDGNVVTVTNSMLDVMDGKVKLDGEIRFK